MIIPRLYTAARTLLQTSEISLGCGGFRLFELSEIEAAQVGYSTTPNGISLCGNGKGAWQPNWIVIGLETACGDPLFMESSDPALPVFTAMHGTGAWEPIPISISLDAFLASLKEFARISVGRNNPVDRDANPISDNERTNFLSRVSALNNGQIEVDFWDALLTS